MRCKQCGEDKQLIFFYEDKSYKSGYRDICKQCTRDKKRIYYLNKQENIKISTRLRRAGDLEKARCYDRKRYEYNKKNNPERIIRKYEVQKISSAIWKKNNPDKVLKWWKNKDTKRRGTPIGKLNDNIRRGISLSLHGGKAGRSWESIVGYTVDDLKKHLEKQFSKGMTWNNYGEWHVDHKNPRSIHNFKSSDDIDFKKCWELKNLQPLWKKDNLIKSNKINEPFQPSLTF